VLPEFQGSGAAQALLHEAIGGADCFLWVASRNARAQSFYRRNGFELDGATKSVVPLDGIEGWRMVRGVSTDVGEAAMAMTSASSFKVRDAGPQDVGDIARVHVDSWRETYSGVLAEGNFSEEAYVRRSEFWGRYLAMDPRPGRMVVAERDGVVVGFANSGNAREPDAEHGFVPARQLHLFSIYLLASAHGSKLGQMMLDAVLEENPAQLWVLRGNDRAIAFYARNGFVADGIEFIDSGDANLVELRMIR
jgi:ribosomal protein S18 acetylase RimI-like enzyme